MSFVMASHVIDKTTVYEVDNQGNIKALHYWPFVEESTEDRTDW